MKLITWNVNGLRSLCEKRDIKSWLTFFEADVILLQETKLSREQLTSALAVVDGFTAYFSFCRTRRGYSGVATYCRDTVTPFGCVEGLTGFCNSPTDEYRSCIGDSAATDYASAFSTADRSLDQEGRTLVTMHSMNGQSLVILNVYCPRVDEDNSASREAFRLKFVDALEKRVRLLMQLGMYVIVAGDINVSHRMIDHFDPGEQTQFYSAPQRLWIDHLLSTSGLALLDCFRLFYPDKTKAFTCWNTRLNCRETNSGSRIDYFLASPSLREHLADCDIRPDIYGSDHCPVVLWLKSAQVEASAAVPRQCAKFYPGLGGRQLQLSAFLRPSSAPLRPLVAGLPGLTSKRKLPPSDSQRSSIKRFFRPTAQ